MSKDEFISVDHDPLQTSEFMDAQAVSNSSFYRHRAEWLNNQDIISDELDELVLLLTRIHLLLFSIDRLKLWLTYQLKRYQLRRHLKDDLKRLDALRTEAKRINDHKWAQILKDWSKNERRRLKKL